MAAEKCPKCGAALVPGDQFCGGCGARVEPKPQTPTSTPTKTATRTPTKTPTPPTATASAPAPKPGLVFWLAASVVILAVGLVTLNAGRDDIDVTLTYTVFVLGPALVILAAVRPPHWLLAAAIAGGHELLILLAVALKDPYLNEDYVMVQVMTTGIAAGLAAAAAAISRAVRAKKP